MELFVFLRFHTLEGKDDEALKALSQVIPPTRDEPGCLGIHAYRSIRDVRLFFIHSRWKSEQAFESHARLPHTVQFLKRIETLIDHALDVTRTEQIG